MSLEIAWAPGPFASKLGSLTPPCKPNELFPDEPVPEVPKGNDKGEQKVSSRFLRRCDALHRKHVEGLLTGEFEVAAPLVPPMADPHGNSAYATICAMSSEDRREKVWKEYGKYNKINILYIKNPQFESTCYLS